MAKTLLMLVATNSEGEPDFSTAAVVRDMTEEFDTVYDEGFNKGWEEGYGLATGEIRRGSDDE